MRAIYQIGWVMVALLVACVESRGQAKVEMLFTNQVVTFTNAQGKVYKDAELVRANTKELVFKTNGNYGVIAFTNLPPEGLAVVGITDNYLKKADELEKQKADAAARAREAMVAEQKRLLDPTNLTEIVVVSMTGRREFNNVYGNVYLCKVRLANGAETSLFVARLPGAVPAYFGALQAKEQGVSQLSNQVDYASMQLEIQKQQFRQRQYEVDRANAITPTYAVGDYWYVTGVMNQRSYVNLAQVELDSAYDKLANNDSFVTNQIAALGYEQMRLDELKNDTASRTLQVLISRYVQSGMRMLVCAPDFLQARNRTNALAVPVAPTEAVPATAVPVK